MTTIGTARTVGIQRTPMAWGDSLKLHSSHITHCLTSGNWRKKRGEGREGREREEGVEGVEGGGGGGGEEEKEEEEEEEEEEEGGERGGGKCRQNDSGKLIEKHLNCINYFLLGEGALE